MIGPSCYIHPEVVHTAEGDYYSSAFYCGDDFMGPDFQGQSRSEAGGGVAISRLQQLMGRLNCAAQYAQDHSIAAAFGLKNNFVAKLLAGNTIADLANLVLDVWGGATPTAAQLGSLLLNGGAQGVPVPPGHPGLEGATGQLTSTAVKGVVSSAFNAVAGVGAEPIELGITAAGTSATSVSGLSAAGLDAAAWWVGVGKFTYDIFAFAYGYAHKCQ